MKTGNIRLLCGGRNNGKTLQQYSDIQKLAVENDYEKVKVEFITPDIIKIQELIDYLKAQIKLCKEAQQLALQNKMIEQVGNFNLRIATYNEILSKIEKL